MTSLFCLKQNGGCHAGALLYSPLPIDYNKASWVGELIETCVSLMTEHGYENLNAYRRVLVLMRFAMVAEDRGTDRWDELPAHVDAFIAAWLGTCLDTINRCRGEQLQDEGGRTPPLRGTRCRSSSDVPPKSYLWR